jgi:hypothetical protein
VPVNCDTLLQHCQSSAAESDACRYTHNISFRLRFIGIHDKCCTNTSTVDSYCVIHIFIHVTIHRQQGPVLHQDKPRRFILEMITSWLTRVDQGPSVFVHHSQSYHLAPRGLPWWYTLSVPLLGSTVAVMPRMCPRFCRAGGRSSFSRLSCQLPISYSFHGRLAVLSQWPRNCSVQAGGLFPKAPQLPFHICGHATYHTHLHGSTLERIMRFNCECLPQFDGHFACTHCSHVSLAGGVELSVPVYSSGVFLPQLLHS